MPRDLVPELHDVLKLTTLQHHFADFDPYYPDAPNTPTWRGVLQHHCSERFPAYPTDRDTFLLHMADGLAANFSRHGQDISGETAWTVHCLWRPEVTAPDRRLGSADQIRAMLRLLASDPDFEGFLGRYSQIFETRAEDARPGMNVTSLETHVRLVGRFYRVLRAAAAFQVSEAEISDAVRQGWQGVASLRKQKQGSWQLHLIKCRPRLLASPFRARDLNAFDCFAEFLSEARRRVADNILFASLEELLIYSEDFNILNTISSLAGQYGIALQIQKKRELLKDADLNFKRRPFESIYPSLEPNIEPPLCEICQMRQATRVWPDDYVASATDEVAEEGRDNLCEMCFSVRARPSKLRKLARSPEWREGEIIWFHIGLDFERLHEALKLLYLAYLRELDPSIPEAKAQVRFSLVGEFQSDYARFLDELGLRLRRAFGSDSTELILPNFFCLRAEGGQEVISLLGVVRDVAQTHLPAFFGLEQSPINVSLALCNAKYPFFEIWRQWENQASDIEITAVGHGRIELRLKQLTRFLELARHSFSRSALHNLAEISRISQALAELRFSAKGEKGERETFEHLSEFLPLGLKFDGILTLAKLMEK